MSDLADVLDFCPGCFATNEDGSWGHTCDDHYCYNCGAQGTVKLPRWAVRSIREQASWVGKRYYPHDEDREAAEEAPLSVEPECPHTLIRHTYTAGETEVRTACVWCGKPIVLVSDPPIDPPAARQPGADAELVERLRARARAMRDGAAVVRGNGGNFPERAVWFDAEAKLRERDAELLEISASAIARLSAPAGPGSEGGEVERLREALERIVRWLEAGCITLDAVSASAMRHVVNGVGQIARAGLEASGGDHHDAGTGET